MNSEVLFWLVGVFVVGHVVVCHKLSLVVRPGNTKNKNNKKRWRETSAAGWTLVCSTTTKIFFSFLDTCPADFRATLPMEQLQGICCFSRLKKSLLGQDVNKKKQFCAECGKAMDEGYKSNPDSPDAYCREDYQKLFGTTKCDVPIPPVLNFSGMQSTNFRAFCNGEWKKISSTMLFRSI